MTSPRRGGVALPTWRTWSRYAPSTRQVAGKLCSRSISGIVRGRLSQWKGPVEGPGCAGGRENLQLVLDDILTNMATKYEAENHATCSASCSDCLRSYDNRRLHGVLDWRLALDLAGAQARRGARSPEFSRVAWRWLIRGWGADCRMAGELIRRRLLDRRQRGRTTSARGGRLPTSLGEMPPELTVRSTAHP